MVKNTQIEITSVPNTRSLETSEFTALLIGCSTNMENSQNKIFIYDKYKCEWNQDIVKQQTNHQNGSRIFEFTNNIKYLSNIPNSSDGKGILYMYHNIITKNVTIMYFIKRKFNLNDGNKFIPSQLINIVKNEKSFFHLKINQLNYLEFKQMVSSINWIKNVIVKLDDEQSEFVSIQDFTKRFQDLQSQSTKSVENKSDMSDDDIKQVEKTNKEKVEKDKEIPVKENKNGTNLKTMNENSEKSERKDNMNNMIQLPSQAPSISTTTNESDKKQEQQQTISTVINNPNCNSSKQPQKTPTNNNDNNSRKFLGGNISHEHLFDKKINNNHKNKRRKQLQATIMEAMGVRYQKMVSPFNSNNIHNQPQLPTIIECKSNCRTIDVYYSDTYGFTKFKFFNPIIKEFNIDIVSNFAKAYKSKIHHEHVDNSRDLRHAVSRAPIGLACTFTEENIFIPFVNISPTHVQFNVGKPVHKNEIPSGLAGLGELLSKENIGDSQWILGPIEKKLFSTRMINKMFKEKSNEFNIDFILNFGNIIRKKAWSRPDFESVIPNLDLSKYYFLSLDEENTYGIPVSFCVWNDNYYVYINHSYQCIGIKRFLSNVKDNLDKFKKSKIMDWNHKHDLMINDKDGKISINKKIFNQLNLIDMKDYDKNVNYIIDSIFIGKYLVIKYKEKLFPIYVLNQNYVRFNNRIVNIGNLHHFVEKQRLEFGNYFIPVKGTKATKVKLLLEYNFTLHHIHDENFKIQEYQDYEKSQKQLKNKKINHKSPKTISKIVAKAIHNYRNNSHKNGNNEDILNGEWTDNGISAKDIQRNYNMGGNGKGELDNDLADIKQDENGNLLESSQDEKEENTPLLDISNDDDSDSTIDSTTKEEIERGKKFNQQQQQQMELDWEILINGSHNNQNKDSNMINQDEKKSLDIEKKKDQMSIENERKQNKPASPHKHKKSG